MDRRDFLKAAGSSVALSSVVSASAVPALATTSAGGMSRSQEASIQVRDGILYMDTPTQTAVMEKGVLTSLKSKQTGEVFVNGVDVASSPALQLIYRGDKAKAFIGKGRTMGFHMMPHFNSIDMDPSHPAYASVRDFQYRGTERHDLRGWSWYQGRGLGVPESNTARLTNRDKKVMIKVHPGLSMWRSILGRAILDAARALAVDTTFIDVTLVTHNLHNCFVEAATPTEGMHKLIRHVATLGRGLAVGGEGLNEITMQGQSFGQAHLFKSWHQSIEGLERAGSCDLNAFLFDGLCRTFGYANLGGQNADQELRMRMHLEHGAIPTVTIRSAREIRSPNAAVRQMLDRAKG